MPKYSPLVAAIIGAILLVLQQYIGNPAAADIKVVGFAVLIGVLGAVSTQLKGKGASLLGIIGTVGYSFYTLYSNGAHSFTWNEFILSAAFAVVTVFAPTAIPEPAPKED